MKNVFIFSSLLLPLFLFSMTAEEKEKFWFKSPEMTLYHKRNRGLSAQAVLKKVPFKVTPRKAPEAVFFHNGKAEKTGNIVFEKIPVSLKEEYGADRDAWIRFGLPLPRGGVFQTRHIRITDAQGKEIPSQSVITSFWPDNSIKWALVQFSVPLKAREEKRCFAEFGSRVTAKKYSGVTFTENDDTITVDTGKITAVIDKKKFTLLKSVHRGKLRLGGFSGVVMQEDRRGYSYRLSPRPPESITVSEKGSLRLTFRIAGKYRTGNAKFTSMDYVARISFYADSEVVDIQYSHTNTDIAREFTDIRSMYLEYVSASPVSGIRTALSSAPVKRIFQETDEFYSLDNGKRLSGKFTGSGITAGKRPLAFGIADACQRYPKALSCQEKKIRIELLPAQPHEEFNRDLPYYLVYPFCDGAYRMKWGMGFTENIRFDFSGKSVEPELNKPVIAVLPAAWYEKTGIFPGLATPGFEKIDKKIIASFRKRVKQGAEQREFGYFNYGDSFGEKRVNWTNNEYDMAHGLFLTFLRTGERDLFRHALAAARHQADVDICHAYPDPYYVGGNLNHRGVHNGAYKIWTSRFNKYQSAANGHTWVRGMLNAWHLAGDARVMDASLLLGDHIALSMVPHYKMPPEAPAPRECAWAMKALAELYRSTGNTLYLKALKTLAMECIRYGNTFPGGLWGFRNPRVKMEQGKDILTNAVFVTGIALMGMNEYYLLTKEKSVKPFIRKIADRIRSAFTPDFGSGFAYDVDSSGRQMRFSVVTLNFCIASPLAEAALILKDPVLFDMARRGMAAGLLRHPGISGKFLAEYTVFLTDFLASHARFPEKYKMDFSEKSMLDQALASPLQNWCWRGADPGKYQLRLLRDGKHKVTFRRWVTNYRIKNKYPAAGLTVSKAGKEIIRLPFDSSRGAFEMSCELSGKKGDVFDIVLRDTGNGDWYILPSENYCHGGVFDPKNFVRLARCGLTRLCFEVPAGKEAKIRFYGTHYGPYGYFLTDEKGNIIRKDSGFQERNAISTAPLSILETLIPPAGKKRLFHLVLWADTDAKLHISNVTVFSGSSAFFD